MSPGHPWSVFHHPFGKGRIPTGRETLSKTRNTSKEIPAASAAVTNDCEPTAFFNPAKLDHQKPERGKKIPEIDENRGIPDEGKQGNGKGDPLRSLGAKGCFLRAGMEEEPSPNPPIAQGDEEREEARARGAWMSPDPASSPCTPEGSRPREQRSPPRGQRGPSPRSPPLLLQGRADLIIHRLQGLPEIFPAEVG